MSLNTDSKISYDEKYNLGYGVVYPEGHIIRLYEHILKHELGFSDGDGRNLLDFGCGNGTHTAYFKSKGMKVIGMDIIPEAINQAKKRFPDMKDNFKILELHQNPQELTDSKYDIIISNQVLYYFNDDHLRKVLKQFNDLLKPDGVIYITMMSKKNYYWEHAKNPYIGLYEVKLTGRLTETTFINFMKSEKHLKETFSLFDPHFIGYYDKWTREGSGHHYEFLGRKTFSN